MSMSDYFSLYTIVTFTVVSFVIVNNCSNSVEAFDVSVQCSSKAMEFFVDFDEPFYGRLKSRGDCMVNGRGRRKLGFRLPLDAKHRDKCAIIQKGDEYIAIVDLEWNEKVITGDDNAYFVRCPSKETDDLDRSNNPLLAKNEASNVIFPNTPSSHQSDRVDLHTGTFPVSMAPIPKISTMKPNLKPNNFNQPAEVEDGLHSETHEGREQFYRAGRCVAFTDGAEDQFVRRQNRNSRSNDARKIQVVQITDSIGCPMPNGGIIPHGQVVNLQRTRRDQQNSMDASTIGQFGLRLDPIFLENQHLEQRNFLSFNPTSAKIQNPFSSGVSNFNIQCEVLACKEKECGINQERCNNHSDNGRSHQAKTTRLASVKVLSVPDGGGFVVDSVNDNDGEDSDWKKYSSYEHCSPDHREQFTLALVVCVLLALCSAFALIITINRSGSMEDRAKKGHATEADQQNTCNVDVANKSSVSSISSYILLKRLCIGRDRRSAAKTSMKFSQEAMKNVPSRPPSRISSAPGEDVLLFDNNKSNQNEKCVHKLPSPFAFQSILSSVENRRSITFLESPMPPILLPDGTLRRRNDQQILEQQHQKQSSCNKGTKPIAAPRSSSGNSGGLSRDSPEATSSTSGEFSLDRLPGPPSISIHEIRELNEAFNSGITRITNDSANSATGNRRNKPDDGEHLNVERTNRMPTIAIRNPAEPKISIEGQLNSAGFVKDITDGRNRWREQQGTTPFTIKTTSKLREGRDVSNGGSEFWRKAIHEENHYGPSNYPIECNTVVPKLQPQQKEKIDSAFTKTVSGKSDNSNCAVVRPTISTASTSKKAPIVFENLQRNKKHELEKSLQRVRQLRENGTREYSKANNKFKTEPHHPN